MTKYTLIVEHEDLYGKPSGQKSTHEFHADTLSTVLENTELFLRGAGFYFEGNLDIIKDEPYEDDNIHLFNMTDDVIVAGQGAAGAATTFTFGGADTITLSDFEKGNR